MERHRIRGLSAAEAIAAMRDVVLPGPGFDEETLVRMFGEDGRRAARGTGRERALASRSKNRERRFQPPDAGVPPPSPAGPFADVEAISGGTAWERFGRATAVPLDLSRPCTSVSYNGGAVTEVLARFVAATEGDTYLDWGGIPDLWSDEGGSGGYLLAGGFDSFSWGTPAECVRDLFWLLVAEADGEWVLRALYPGPKGLGGEWYGNQSVVASVAITLVSTVYDRVAYSLDPFKASFNFKLEFNSINAVGVLENVGTADVTLTLTGEIDCPSTMQETVFAVKNEVSNTDVVVETTRLRSGLLLSRRR